MNTYVHRYTHSYTEAHRTHEHIYKYTERCSNGHTDTNTLRDTLLQKHPYNLVYVLCWLILCQLDTI